MATRHDRQAFASGMLLGVTLTGLGVVLTQTLFGPILARSLASPEEQILSDVHQRLVDQYVAPLDQGAVMRSGVEGMITALGDEYSTFVPPDRQTNYAEESSGRLIGIGIQITQEARVRYPAPGGPAEAAGLRPGDTLLAIDGQSTDGLDLDSLADLIKGPLDSAVHLQVQRHSDGELFEVEIERKPVPTGTVGRIEMLDQEHGLGRIHIRSFARSTAGELDAALDRLMEQGMRGLVLDLRFNRGGLLDAAVACASRFIEGGVVCTLHGRNQPTKAWRADPDAFRDLGIPVVVLLNEHSASGSEVLAAALRDHGVAVIAGQRSYGKGVYQQVQTYLSGEPGMFTVKFTAGYYVTPGGQIIEGHLDPSHPGGLEPDLPCPKIGLEQSRLLLVALQQDQIPPQYRDEVVAIWEVLENWPVHPPDPATDHALAALRQSLDPSV